MGIDLKQPGDDGWYSWGKKNQLHVRGWGCLIYPLIWLVILLLAFVFEIHPMAFIIGGVILSFIIIIISNVERCKYCERLWCNEINGNCKK